MEDNKLRNIFPGGHLTERMKRLFWFREKPPSDEELEEPQVVLSAVATILREGDMLDWRAFDR